MNVSNIAHSLLPKMGYYNQLQKWAKRKEVCLSECDSGHSHSGMQ